MANLKIARYGTVAIKNFLALFGCKSSKKEEDSQQKALSFEVLEREAFVEETIYPHQSGRVYFQGSWWPARCKCEMVLLPGEVVYVVGIKRITLLVEPSSCHRASQVIWSCSDDLKNESDSERLNRLF